MSGSLIMSILLIPSKEFKSNETIIKLALLVTLHQQFSHVHMFAANGCSGERTLLLSLCVECSWLGLGLALNTVDGQGYVHCYIQELPEERKYIL